MALEKKKIRIIVRSAVAVVYLLLAVCMFITGRSHTVLIDNHAVNHNPPSEFMKGDRDKFTVKGQKLVIKVQSFDGSIDEVYTLKIPLAEDSVIVSVPRLAAGLDGAMEHFDLN